MTSEIGDDAVQAWIAAVREEQARTEDTKPPTRREIREALTHAAGTARRMPQVVGNETYSTPWDRMHEYVNGLLDELVGL